MADRILEDRLPRPQHSGERTPILAEQHVQGRSVLNLLYPQSSPQRLRWHFYIHTMVSPSPRVLGLGLTVESTFWSAQRGRDRGKALSGRGRTAGEMGYQAIGKIKILSACRMLVSTPATLHGFPGLNSPQVGASALSYISFPGEQLIPFLPAPYQFWPLGAAHAGGNTDLLQPVQKAGFGQGAGNHPTCTMKPRKRMKKGARWELGEGLWKGKTLEEEKSIDRHLETKPGDQGSVDTGPNGTLISW